MVSGPTIWSRNRTLLAIGSEVPPKGPSCIEEGRFVAPPPPQSMRGLDEAMTSLGSPLSCVRDRNVNA